jgi:hypothetical protein
METYGSGGVAPPILTSALDGGEWSASWSDSFNLRERAQSIHLSGGCLGPRVSLDAVEKRKILHCQESNSNYPEHCLSLYLLSYPEAYGGQYDMLFTTLTNTK